MANAILSSATPNQASVQAELTGLTTGSGATYAQKSYVDSQDATFSTVSYYQTQDALNVPNSVVGAVNQVSGVNTAITGSYYGVASLDSSGKLPAAQMPVLGAGYVQGPYGPTAVSSGTSTTNTPVKIADWNIGATSLSFQPLVFMQCFLQSTVGHPVIEVRIANTTTAPTYAGSTLCGIGVGRGIYNDYTNITVLPCGSTTSQTPTALGPGYNVWISAWMYDALSSTVTLSAGGVASAAALLLRTAQ